MEKERTYLIKVDADFCGYEQFYLIKADNEMDALKYANLVAWDCIGPEIDYAESESVREVEEAWAIFGDVVREATEEDLAIYEWQ